MTATNLGIINYLVVVRIVRLDSLDADVRDQFLTIVNEVTKIRYAQFFSLNQVSRKAVSEADNTVRMLTPEERSERVDVMKPV